MKKILSITAILMLILTSITININAAELNTYISEDENSPYYIEYPTYKVNIEGSEYNLLQLQYVDNALALEAFKNTNSTEITNLEGTLGLTFDISPNSEFFTALNENIDLQLSHEEFIISYLEFYDTYENKEINNETIEQMNTPKVSKYSSSEHEYYEELGIVIPFYEAPPTIEKYFTFNVSSANNYASTYATTYNSATYGWLSKDCTNFASQIMHSGGKSQSVSTDKNSGWWYKKGTANVCSPTTGCYDKAVFTYSTSWINAGSFANYFGKDYTYKNSYTNFKTQIREGDFIAIDENNDGTSNHIGYVYDVAGSDSTKKVYVAQHTTNYKKEISATHWPEECSSGTCYIVRP